MSSGTANYDRIHFGDLQWERRYRPNFAYAQSKLADLMLTMHLTAIAARHVSEPALASHQSLHRSFVRVRTG